MQAAPRPISFQAPAAASFRPVCANSSTVPVTPQLRTPTPMPSARNAPLGGAQPVPLPAAAPLLPQPGTSPMCVTPQMRNTSPMSAQQSQENAESPAAFARPVSARNRLVAPHAPSALPTVSEEGVISAIRTFQGYIHSGVDSKLVTAEFSIQATDYGAYRRNLPGNSWPQTSTPRKLPIPNADKHTKRRASFHPTNPLLEAVDASGRANPLLEAVDAEASHLKYEMKSRRASIIAPVPGGTSMAEGDAGAADAAGDGRGASIRGDVWAELFSRTLSEGTPCALGPIAW